MTCLHIPLKGPGVTPPRLLAFPSRRPEAIMLKLPKLRGCGFLCEFKLVISPCKLAVLLYLFIYLQSQKNQVYLTLQRKDKPYFYF